MRVRWAPRVERIHQNSGARLDKGTRHEGVPQASSTFSAAQWCQIASALIADAHLRGGESTIHRWIAVDGGLLGGLVDSVDSVDSGRLLFDAWRESTRVHRVDCFLFRQSFERPTFDADDLGSWLPHSDVSHRHIWLVRGARVAESEREGPEGLSHSCAPRRP